jgi:hypothetical protein
MSQVVRVRVDGSEEELRSFARWLGEEPDIRHRALISWETPRPGEGEMGGAFDVVKLVIDSGFQIASLGLAYVAWRATRPRPTSVTIERDGVRITLDDGDPETVARLLRALDE